MLTIIELNTYYPMQNLEGNGDSGSDTVEISGIKIPSRTINVMGWGDNEEFEELEIPRGKSNSCLPLPNNVKYVRFR